MKISIRALAAACLVAMLSTLLLPAAAAACDYVLQTFPVAHDRRPRVFNLATESVNEMLHGMVDWVTAADQPCDVVISGAPYCCRN